MEVIKPIIALLGGGFAGYCTNYYAIKMLFKKYGPFGGMIIKTREQFVISMSHIVERDIINNHTIEQELSKFEFQRVLYKMVSDVLKIHLYNHTGTLTLRDFPGIKDTIPKLINFYKDNSGEFASSSMQSVLDAIQIQEIVGKKQRLFFIDKLWELFLRECLESHTVENVIQGLYQENKDKSLDRFIQPEVFKILSQNAIALTSQLHERLERDFPQDVDELMGKLYDELECNKIVQSLEKKIKAKSIQEFLGRESAENLAKEMLERGIALLQSSEGEGLLKEFTSKMFTIVKSITISIHSLFTDEIRDSLESYLRNQLPIVIEKIIDWIKENQSELDHLINTSIDEVLADGSSGLFDFRSKGKRALKAVIYENLARESEIMDYIIKSIEQDTDVKVISSKVTHFIMNYLKDNSIGQMISLLENKDILNSEELARLVKKNINIQAIQENSSMFEALLHCPIGDILQEDFSPQIEDAIKNIVIDYCKTKFVYSSSAVYPLQEEVANLFTSLAPKDISQLLSLEGCNNLAKFGEEKILTELKRQKSPIMNLLLEELQTLIADKKLSYYWKNNLKQNSIKVMADKSLHYLEKKVVEGENQPLAGIYDKINNQKDSVKEVTSLIIELSNKNLQGILEGKIQDTIAANLSRLPDAEIQAIVENIMGKELKPINLFGAILGAITGGLMYLAQSVIAGPIDPGAELAISLAVYGFIGYITNVIALKMIFRPYYEKVFMGIKIPFTPGVVAKQKPRFAASMGEFVEESLLDGKRINYLFKENRAEIEKGFEESLSFENYQLAEKVLIDNRELISDKVFGILLHTVDKNKEAFLDHIMEALKAIELSKLDYTELESAIQYKSYAYLKNKEYLLSKPLFKLLQSDKNLNDLLPNGIKTALYNSITDLLTGKMEKVIALISKNDYVTEMIGSSEKTFENILTKQIGEQLTIKQRENMKEAISTYLNQKIQSSATCDKLLRWMDKKIAEELAPDKKIGELFGGRLIHLLQQNMEFIIGRVVSNVQAKAEKQRGPIKKQIYVTFRQKANCMTKIADRILDIESSIYNVVDHFIDKKLPNYTKEKEHEFRKILIEFMQGKIADSRISDIGIEMDGEGLKRVAMRLLESEHTAAGLKQLSDPVMDFLFKVPIKEVLHIISVENLYDIYNVFTTEIEETRLELTAKLVDKQSALVYETGIFMKKVLEKVVLPLKVHELTTGIHQNEVDKAAKKIVAAISDSKVLATQLAIYSKNLSNTIKYSQLNQFIDFSAGKDDCRLVLHKIIFNEEIRTALKLGFRGVMNPLLANSNGIFATETKDFASHIVIKSVLDSLEDHLLEVMNAVNVKEVTKREINNMEPKEIEALFHSFALPYFEKIEKYGWFGGGFALLTSMIEKMWNIIGK